MTRTVLEVLAFAFLPAGGILLGCLLAEVVRSPRWLIGASLHATAGIAIALVSVDVMPRLLALAQMPLILLAFLVGAAISVTIASVFGSMRHRRGGGSVGAWMVYFAVTTDLVSDGLMVGGGTAVGESLGLLLALTQAVANIPGGFAATSNFRDDGMSRLYRLILATSLLVPAILSAALGFVVLRNAGPELQGFALAVFMGVLLLATIEDIIPQGDEPNPPRWISTAAFAMGFAAFAWLAHSLW